MRRWPGISTPPAGCARRARRWGCCRPSQAPGSAVPARTPRRSRRRSPNGWPRANRAISPAPTPSVPTWRRRALCWRTAPAAPRGDAPADDQRVTGREGGADLAPIGASPVVVLVRPQLADNIGACARAMANGGLFHLRLVAPRDGWPQAKAWRMSSGAERILDAATVHATVPDAVADLHHVFATCPRPRHIVKPVLTARGAAVELREICGRGLRAGLLFGPERAGLDNDDMAHADALVRFPLNPTFMSLNLAQAVIVVAY